MKSTLFSFSCLLASAGVLAAQSNTFPASGNTGIGTTSPSHKLEVHGDIYTAGALKIGELYYSPNQTINLGLGTERWIKLATVPNNHTVRFLLRNGSTDSEEIAEVKVMGTYYNHNTAISVDRQTYHEHLREVRVTGADGYPRTVYIKIRATSYAPSIVWRAIESKGTITIHNIEETPSGGLAHIVSGNLVTSTNMDFVSTGKVGIGTTNPFSRLTLAKPVAHSISVEDEFNNAALTIAGSDEYVRLQLGVGGSSLGPWGGWIQASYDNSPGGSGNSGAEPLLLNPAGGNVGIGTTNPSHKLAVNGTIRAKEVIVDTGWADYVFDEGYRLAPLAEVEAHILEEKRLPGIPSADEVEAGGVSLGDMQARMMAKIEELTLHLIAQEKLLTAHAGELRILRQENTELRSQLSKSTAQP